MILSGIVEASTVDYRGHLSTVFFFKNCNAHCSYCHNGEMMANPNEKEYTEDEIRRTLKLGMSDAIVISGGEPLLYKDDVITLLHIADELGLRTMINTNGSLPDAFLEILDTGLLSAVSIDVKGTFGEDYFEKFGINSTYVKRSLALANLYNIPLEVRLTICKSPIMEDEVRAVSSYVQGTQCDFILQQFVPSEGILDKSLSLAYQPTRDEMIALAKIATEKVRKVFIRTTKGLERIK